MPAQILSGCSANSYRPAYRRWTGMMARCYDRTDDNYVNYGGRGIVVCKRWHTFENFYADMGNPPSGFTLERKDNSKGYSPDNCRWATMLEQANNRRNNTPLTIAGKTLTPAQWARELRISPQAFLRRVARTSDPTEWIKPRSNRGPQRGSVCRRIPQVERQQTDG